MLQSSCPPMLAYLKPKRSSTYNKKCCMMENYAHTTNWNYRANSPIHCKKDNKTSKMEKKIEELTLDKGRCRLNSHDSVQTVQNYLTQTQNKIAKIKQIQCSQNKNPKQNKNILTIQLSTFYKKKFKYNTTIHQIIKNAHATNNRRFSYQRHKASIIQHENHSFREQGMTKGVGEENQNNLQRYAHVDHLKNRTERRQEGQIQQQKLQSQSKPNITKQMVKQMSCQLKTASFQFRVSKPHFTMLKWKTQPKRKKSIHFKSKNQPQNQSQSYITLKPSLNDQKAGYAFSQPIINDEKQITDFICFQTQKQQIKQYNPPINTQRPRLKNPPQEHSYRKFKYNQKVQKPITNAYNPQFIVDAWSTKQKDQLELSNSIVMK